MALITLSALLTDITGSIGGTTFQNTKAGLIARSKPMGRKASTASQSTARQFPSRFIGSWWALSDADQAAWGVYASAHPHTNRFGQVKNWSGFQCYESVNYNLVRAGMAQTTSPPTYFGAEAVDAFTVVITDGDIQITFGGGTTPVDSVMAIWSSYYVGSTYTSNRSRYRFMKVANYGGGIVDFSFATEWQNVFGLEVGAIPSGETVKVIAGVQNINTKDGTAGAIVWEVGEFTHP